MPHRRSSLAGLLFVSVLVYGCAQSSPTPTASPTLSVMGATATPIVSASPAPSSTATTTATAAPSGGLPNFSHVWVLVLENASFGVLAHGATDPYYRSLIARYGLAANYFAVSHPSEPNYLALFSGSTQGVADDGTHDIAAPNLADQLQSHGKTWHVYEQGYPGGCYAGSSASGASEGFGVSGGYARKHDPAISFNDIRTNPSECANITSLTAFDPAAADYELIVPNTCNDMHSCSEATADAFLASFVPHIVSSPAFANSALFITTDEGSGANQVSTLVISPLVKAGFSSSVRHDHYSLLRTIEDAWGLGCLGQSCSANDMSEFFGS